VGGHGRTHGTAAGPAELNGMCCHFDSDYRLGPNVHSEVHLKEAHAVELASNSLWQGLWFIDHLSIPHLRAPRSNTYLATVPFPTPEGGIEPVRDYVTTRNALQHRCSFGFQFSV